MFHRAYFMPILSSGHTYNILTPWISSEYIENGDQTAVLTSIFYLDIVFNKSVYTCQSLVNLDFKCLTYDSLISMFLRITKCLSAAVTLQINYSVVYFVFIKIPWCLFVIFTCSFLCNVALTVLSWIRVNL